MGLSLQRDDALNVLHAEPVGSRLVGRSKLLHHGTLCKGHVVLVGRQDLVGVLLCGFLNHGKEARFHLLAVDDERAAEDLVAAVLRVNLGEAEDLRVSQRATVLLLQSVQVLYLLGREGQTFLFVIFLQVFHVLDGLGLDVDGEDALVKPVVHALQHLVVFGLLAAHGEILLNTRNAIEIHVLRNLNGIGRPGSDHFAARPHIVAFELLALEHGGIAIEPT